MFLHIPYATFFYIFPCVDGHVLAGLLLSAGKCCNCHAAINKEKQEDRSPPVFFLPTAECVRLSLCAPQLRRDAVAVRMRHAAAIVALAGRRAAREGVVG